MKHDNNCGNNCTLVYVHIHDYTHNMQVKLNCMYEPTTSDIFPVIIK